MTYLQRAWRRTPELMVVFGLILGTTLLFWLTDLDLVAGAWFFDPTSPDQPWPYEDRLVWSVLYKGAWILAGAFALGGVAAVILARLRPGLRKWQPRGWFLILVVIVGSGLVVNVVFKDHWGRFRPRQIEQLGGVEVYQPPLQPGARGQGKSFPCGHCSAGFAFMAFWLIWRRERPRLARASLVLGLSLGLLMGIGRMAAGGHFLSDVLWSGFMMFLIAWVLYYLVLRLPERERQIVEAGEVARLDLKQKVALGAASLAVVIGALLAKPMNLTQEELPDPESLGLAREIRILADEASVQVDVRPSDPPLTLRLEVRSFGLPWNEVSREWHFDPSGPFLDYRLRHRGVYTERMSRLAVSVDPALVPRLRIRLDRGDVVIHGMPEPLGISTGAGEVTRRP